MDPKTLTDEIIESLLLMPKVIRNKKAKETEKAKHAEKNYEVRTTDGLQSFTLFVRQSTLVSNSFSCGLLWHSTPTQKVMLTRYNGGDHHHSNPLEDEEFESCHIHRATERYIAIGKKVEHYATPTARYKTVNDALGCLCEDCNISGLFVPNEDGHQGNLFDL
jgi:hypothetical protein